MRDRLAHRGPDDAGTWQSGDGRACFGHRRLAIIDLTPGGHQPKTSASGRLTITFNGEIYNYRQLRSELTALGRTFQTGSDTEVLLEAWEEWGEGAIAHLRGMFAFALWDSRSGMLFAARDRAGEKPFYYWCQGGELWFASELQALLENPALPRKTTPALLDHFLAEGYPPPGEAMIAGVRRLPAGQLLAFRPGDPSPAVRPYWNLPAACADAPPLALDQLADRLSGLLESAVDEQLHADVPVGVLLSGGVDSSLITALAARARPRSVRTFTVTFPNAPRFNEAGYAQRVAAHCGTVHRELPLPEPALELPERLGRALGEPMGDSSILPTFLVSQLIRGEATVAVGGDGGDELFGGYIHHSLIQRYERLHRFIPAGVARTLARSAEWGLPIDLPGRGVMVQALGGPATKLSYARLLGPRLRSRFLSPLRGQSAGLHQLRFAALQGLSALEQSTRTDFAGYMVDDILAKVDRASMLTSLEVRAPFLDQRIIEFAFGEVPQSAKATIHARKILLRHVAARYLPADLDLDRKQGFSIPLGGWLRTRWRAPLAAALTSRSFAEWVSPREVAGILRRLDAGRTVEHQVFALWMLAVWKDEHGISL